MEDDERKNVVASGIGTLLTMGGGNISIDYRYGYARLQNF